MLIPPSSQEKIGWTLGILLLFVSNYYMQEQFNLVYRSLQVAAFLSVLLYSNLARCVFSPHFIPLFVGLVVLLFLILIQHGDLLLREYFLTYLRGCFLFVLGFCLCKNANWRNYAVMSVLLGLALVAAFDSVRIILGDGIGASRAYIASLLDQGFEVSARGRSLIIDKYIYHVPAMVFFSILSFSLYDLKFKWKVLALLLQGSIFLGVLLSSWLLGYILLFAGLALIIYLAPLSRKYRKFFIPVLIGLGFIVLFIGYYTATSTEVGESNFNRDRIVLLVSGFTSGNFELINEASGGRFDLYRESLTSFISSPILGTGFFFASWDAGGHSSFFDFLAYGGLLGGVPLLAIPLVWTALAYKNYRRTRNWFTTAAFASIFLFCVGSVINPYYLTTTMITFPIFLLGGMISGTYYYGRNRRI